MKIQGAVIREQGQTFAVVVVKPSVVADRPRAADTARKLSPTFGHVPVVLMAQDSRGRPTFFGRPDIARFLAGVALHRIPWRDYHLS